MTLEHRMGPEGGASLNEQAVFERVGFEKELMSRGVKLERSFTNRKLFDEFFEAMHRRYKARLRSWVRSYRNYLSRLYQPQEFKPVFGYVPTDDFNKPILMIAGFIDIKTLAPVAGDLELITRALELKNVHLQPLVDEYQENRQIAKRMLTISGVNKDLQHRLGQVVSGNVEKIQLIERYEG